MKLTNDELFRQLDAARLEQDSNKVQELEWVLIEKNGGLVGHLAKQLCNPGYDYDDIVQIGKIGLIKAVRKYDISKGAKFATFAGRLIQNEIFMYYRKNTRHEDIISLDEPITNEDDGSTAERYALIKDAKLVNPEDIYGTGSLVKWAEQAISESVDALFPKSRMDKEKFKKFVLATYLGTCNLTQMEASEELDICQAQISRCMRRVRVRIERLYQQQCC